MLITSIYARPQGGKTGWSGFPAFSGVVLSADRIDVFPIPKNKMLGKAQRGQILFFVNLALYISSIFIKKSQYFH